VTPVLCLVTDRHRSGPAWETVVADRVRAAARAGVHLVQVRERDLDGGPLMLLTAACLDAVRGTPARVVVNDRLDVALAAGAHGVHLRGDSMPAPRVRRVVPAGFVIGRSVHSVDETRAATALGGLDYLIFGTVFESASKPGLAPAGLGALAAVAGATILPVLAIGGVTSARIGEVMAAGAAGVAAIGMFDTPARVP
jgi:thiamine-phosphate pyrophosphorylase